MTGTAAVHRVVVGVDGSPGSEGAVRYAIAEARRRQVSLTLVHVLADGLNVVPVIAPVDFREVGREVLDAAVQDARNQAPDLVVDGALEIGQRSIALVDAARDAALLVVGRETRSGWERLLTGTTTAAVAAHASCDVVVVPSFWTAGEARRVVAGVRSVRDAGDVVDRAFAEAVWRGCPLTLVTAWHIPDPYFDRIEARTHADEWEANGRADLAQLVAPLRAVHPEVEVDLKVVHGRPAPTLLAAADDSDLLVVTRRHFAIPPHERLGAVGQAVLRLSDVPVLVVPCDHDRAAASALVLEEAGAPLK